MKRAIIDIIYLCSRNFCKPNQLCHLAILIKSWAHTRGTEWVDSSCYVYSNAVKLSKLTSFGRNGAGSGRHTQQKNSARNDNAMIIFFLLVYFTFPVSRLDLLDVEVASLLMEPLVVGSSIVVLSQLKLQHCNRRLPWDEQWGHIVLGAMVLEQCPGDCNEFTLHFFYFYTLANSNSYTYLTRTSMYFTTWVCILELKSRSLITIYLRLCEII